MHVDCALRAPDPVVLWKRIGGSRLCLLDVRAVAHVRLPFHAREIDAPSIAGSWTTLSRRSLFQDLPRQRQLDRPTSVAIARPIQRAFDIDTRLQPVDTPAIDRRTAVAIRRDEHQIPRRGQRIHFELVICVRVAVRIDEYFEVVVAEDDGIALGQCPPDIRLFHLRGDEEPVVVPQHLRARPEAGLWTAIALDIDEGVRPRRNVPRGIVQFAVDRDRRRSSKRDVVSWRKWQGFEVRILPLQLHERPTVSTVRNEE